MMRILLIALVSLALAGCWIGQSLYASSDARPAIPPGLYQASGPDMSKRVYLVSLLPNGLTQFDTGEKQEVYGFAPLGGDAFVGWIQIEGSKPDEDNQIYGLVVRQSGGAFTIHAPECKNEQGEIARKNGATVEPGTPPACRFSTRASLEKAMRLMRRDPASALRLERIP